MLTGLAKRLSWKGYAAGVNDALTVTGTDCQVCAHLIGESDLRQSFPFPSAVSVTCLCLTCLSPPVCLQRSLQSFYSPLQQRL